MRRDERRVIVNGAINPEPGDLEIRVNGDDPTFRLYLGESSRHTPDWFEPRERDLLLIAAAVFAADSSVGRGGDTRPDLGGNWFRSFRFVIPVEDVLFWTLDTTSAALVDALTFLTGDAFTFQFVPSDWKPRPDLLSHLPRILPARRDVEVILFSGGLDSLTGTIETLTYGDAKVLLVTHRSASKSMTVQKQLIQLLKSRFSHRVNWFPVRAVLTGLEAAETTQRSRSFLFAALGYVAARTAGANRVRFYENGIVTTNLPISRQVVSTMATRTTHPLVLRRLSVLLGLVAEEPMQVDNPYLWLTKTEVVGRLASLGGADLAAQTVSCSNIRERTTLHTHCGCCSQCLDRRFAMLAADLAACDPAEMYEVDVLFGDRRGDLTKTMAIDWLRHALRLKDMDPRAFFGKYAAEVADFARAFPERSSGDVQAELFALHRRHGASVARVLNRAVEESAALIVAGPLASNSLLRMVGAGLAGPDPVARAPEQIRPQPDTEQDWAAAILPLRLTLVEGGPRPVLIVHGLDRIEGEPVTVVVALKPVHDEDRVAGIPASSFRYTHSGTLATTIGVSKSGVRQLVKRCRDQLAEFYEVIEGTPPPGPLLINNKSPDGYRIDPESRFVEAEEK